MTKYSSYFIEMGGTSGSVPDPMADVGTTTALTGVYGIDCIGAVTATGSGAGVGAGIVGVGIGV